MPDQSIRGKVGLELDRPVVSMVFLFQKEKREFFSYRSPSAEEVEATYFSASG
jgi:hypothetical protein